MTVSIHCCWGAPFISPVCVSCVCALCAVSVVDALGDIAATRGFSFYTNSTNYGTTPGDIDQSDIGGGVRGRGRGAALLL